MPTAKDLFSDQVLSSHDAFANSGYCSCNAELAASLNFRQRVQEFAHAAPEELFPEVMTSVANGAYRCLENDTIFAYGTAF